MFKLLRRLIGADRSVSDPAEQERKPGSATGAILAKGQRSRGAAGPASRPVDRPPAAGPIGAARGTTAGKAAAPANSPEPDFDPYNTGVFDRSSSWKRIGKR